MFLYVSVIVLNHILGIFCRLCCKINKNFLYNNTYNIFFFCFYIFFAGVPLVSLLYILKKIISITNFFLLSKVCFYKIKVLPFLKKITA